MKTETLFRLAGAASMLAGAGRVVAAFPWSNDAISREAVYDGIDVLLLFAVMGIYFVRREKLGVLGFVSFAVAVAALSFIGGPDADPFGFSTYTQGAYALAIAMVGLSLAWLRAGEHPLAPPVFWFGAAIAGGVLARLPAPIPTYGLAAGGILFGLGFVAAGFDLVRRH